MKKKTTVRGGGTGETNGKERDFQRILGHNSGKLLCEDASIIYTLKIVLSATHPSFVCPSIHSFNISCALQSCAK